MRPSKETCCGFSELCCSTNDISRHNPKDEAGTSSDEHRAVTTILKKHIGIQTDEDEQRWQDISSVMGFGRSFEIRSTNDVTQVREIQIRWKKLSLLRTRGGYLSLGPYGTLPDDEICILGGCDVPLIFRETELGWQLIGTCWVYGISDEEWVPWLKGGRSQIQEVLLH